MFIIVGLIVLIAAVVVGVAGAQSNIDTAHTLPDNVTLFGHHVAGTVGTLFLYGIAVGAVGALGLLLLLAGARRSSRRTRAARRELRATRRAAASASQARDKLIEKNEQPPANRAEPKIGGRHVAADDAGVKTASVD